MVFLSGVVHQFNSMKLLSKTCLHLFKEKLEKLEKVVDSLSPTVVDTHSYSTWGHSPGNCPYVFKQHLPCPCISPNQSPVYITDVFCHRFYLSMACFVFQIHSLTLSFAGWKMDMGTFNIRKALSFLFFFLFFGAVIFCVGLFVCLFFLDDRS